MVRRVVVLAAGLALGGCASTRHFAADSIWPFGNPHRPAALSETTERSLGRPVDVAPISPQAGNVWPGPVQPVPTIAEEQKAMNQPLGSAYTPSLPSPYPPGTAPPPDADLGAGPLGAPGTQSFALPDGGAAAGSGLGPLGGPLPAGVAGTGR